MSEVPSFYYLKKKNWHAKKLKKKGQNVCIPVTRFPQMLTSYITLVQLWNYKIMVAIL